MSESCCGHEHENEHEHANCACGHDHDHEHNETAPKARHVNISIMLLGFAVAAIFLIAIFSYQVPTTERAVVLTLGKITSVEGPGLHFRWPLPIQKVMKYDTRLRCFDGNIGQLEETPTSDGKNITISIYTVYKINDLVKFQSAGGSLASAEEQLGILMRTAKGAVVGSYRFDEIVNSDPKAIKIQQMEADMLKMIAPNAEEQYGLKVVSANIRTIGVPDNPAKAIADRMISERKAKAAKYKSEGDKISKAIMTKADAARMQVLTEAEAEAKKLRAEGDAAAAAHYAVFRDNPELALFLRKLDSMKRLMGNRTTLILDTSYAPFDILKYGTTLSGTAGGK